MSFAKNMGRNIIKNISKYLSRKYGQKLLEHAKQSATDAIKTNSKTAIQNTAIATSNLISDKSFENIHHRIIQKQMKKKKLEKDLYFQSYSIKLWRI